MHLGSYLTYDDGARADALAAEYLYTAPLRIAVATVTGASLSFFVCHDFYLLDGDFGDLHTGQGLTMTGFFMVAFPSLHPEHHDFRALFLSDDFADDLCPFNHGSSQTDIFTAGNHQHFVENETVSLDAFNFLNGQHIPGGDEMLLAACSNDCVHSSIPYKKILANSTRKGAVCQCFLYPVFYTRP